MAGIFTKDGRPITFWMLNHAMYPILKMQIENNGGLMTQDYAPGCISLVPFQPNYELREEPEEPVYSYKYVQESAMIGQLQNIENYRLKAVARKPMQVTYQTFFKQARNSYTEAEDNLIVEYVRAHPGKTSSLAYWKKALKEGLKLQHHTDESLRFHWKTLEKTQKDTKTPPSKRRQVKDYSFVKQPDGSKPTVDQPLPEEESPQEELKSEPESMKRKHSPDSQGPSKRLHLQDAEQVQSQPASTQDILQVASKAEIKIKVSSNGSRQILNYKKLKEQCEEMGIFQQFEKLLSRCRKAAQRNVTEAEVLNELKRQKGRVIPTIAKFMA